MNEGEPLSEEEIERLEKLIDVYDSEIQVRDFLGDPVTDGDHIKKDVDFTGSQIYENGKHYFGDYDPLTGRIRIASDAKLSTLDHETLHSLSAKEWVRRFQNDTDLEEGFTEFLREEMNEDEYAKDRSYRGHDAIIEIYMNLREKGSHEYAVSRIIETYLEPALLEDLLLDAGVVDDADEAAAWINKYTSFGGDNARTQTDEESTESEPHRNEIASATTDEPLAEELVEGLKNLGYSRTEISEMLENMTADSEPAESHEALTGTDTREAHEQATEETRGELGRELEASGVAHDRIDELISDDGLVQDVLAGRASVDDVLSEVKEEIAGDGLEAADPEVERWMAEGGLPGDLTEQELQEHKEELARQYPDATEQEIAQYLRFGEPVPREEEQESHVPEIPERDLETLIREKESFEPGGDNFVEPGGETHEGGHSPGGDSGGTDFGREPYDHHTGGGSDGGGWDQGNDENTGDDEHGSSNE